MRRPFLIIQSRFYSEIEDALFDGASYEFERSQLPYKRVRVPGVLELPLALSMLWKDETYVAAVVLGCVIRGETTHYDTVCNESNRAIMDLAIANKIPLGNAILTVENRDQAMRRADRNQLDKGGAAAKAAIALWKLKYQIGNLVDND
jgi:6,7-dimethyl-8-ribityllumazine synthase